MSHISTARWPMKTNIEGKVWFVKDVPDGRLMVSPVAPYRWQAHVFGKRLWGTAGSSVEAKRQASVCYNAQKKLNRRYTMKGPPITREMQMVFGGLGVVTGIIVYPGRPHEINVNYEGGSSFTFVAKEATDHE